jgi:hypothetical protein
MALLPTQAQPAIGMAAAASAVRVRRDGACSCFFSGVKLRATPSACSAQAGGFGAVVEHVAEVTAAAVTKHLGALHEQGRVDVLVDRAGQRLPEAGPAGVAFELDLE